MKPLHISLNTAHSGCKPNAFISSFTIHTKSSFLYPHISPLPPPHFYRQTHNHPHSYVPHAQTTSIYPASPPHQRSVHPKDFINPHCISYSGHIATLCKSISPSSIPFSSDFADLLSSSPRFQSRMSMHSGHRLCISFHLCGMMHPGLSG